MVLQKYKTHIILNLLFIIFNQFLQIIINSFQIAIASIFFKLINHTPIVILGTQSQIDNTKTI